MSRAAAVRRRRTALGAVALLAAIAGAVVGSRDQSADPLPLARQAEPPPACPDRIASDRRRLVGQTLVVRMEATATDSLRRAARRGELGGVVVFPPAGTDPGALRAQISSLRAAARAAGAPRPLVAIDQEGGEVERLPELPPETGAPQLGAEGRAKALAAGRRTGAALARLGIDVDLAPVLDVPSIDGAFIATRAFANDPEVAGAAGVGFGEGLQRAGVAATAKHFPGLGRAAANTDLGPSLVEATRDQLDHDLEPFRRAAAAGLDLIMLANATYPAYDPDAPASQSRRIATGLLRGRLGYRGVVITDDLGAGALVGAGIDEAEAAVGAARAGSDLLLFALSDGESARRALLRALRSGELERRDLIDSCKRVTALRERLAPAARSSR